MKSSMWDVSGESRPSTHSGLFGELLATDALLSWGSSLLRASALLQGKGVCAGRQPPAFSAAYHPALCLLDIWMDLLLGLLGTEPSSLLLEPGVEHRMCVCVCMPACVHMSGKCLSECRGRLVLRDCNWEWIYRSEWRDCGCVTPHTSPVDNSYQSSRVHVHKLCSQIPGLKTSLSTQWL